MQSRTNLIDDIWFRRSEILDVPTRSVVPNNGLCDDISISITQHSSDTFIDADNENCEGVNSDDFQHHLSRKLKKRIAQPLVKNWHSLLNKMVRSKDSKHDVNTIHCLVVFLDGTSTSFFVHKLAVGQQLFDSVTNFLKLKDNQYFGLAYYGDSNYAHKFISAGGCVSNISNLTKSDVSSGQCFCTDRSNQRSDRFNGNLPYLDIPFWLEMDKKIADQCQGKPLYFQVKFYPRDPHSAIKCPNTRHQFCLQLRRHLWNGRILCTFNNHIILGALITQIDSGDAAQTKRAVSECCANAVCHCDASLLHYSNRTDTVQPINNRPHSTNCSLADCESTACYTTQLYNSKLENAGENNSLSVTRCQSLPKIRPIPTHNTPDHLTAPNCFSHLTCTPASSQQIVVDALDNTRMSLLTSIVVNSDRCTTPILDILTPGWPYLTRSCQHCCALLKHINHLHRKYRGMSHTDAEILFLKQVKQFASYGVELHPFRKFSAHNHPSGLLRRICTLNRSFSERRYSHASMDDPENNETSHTTSHFKRFTSCRYNNNSNIAQSIKRRICHNPAGSLFPFAFDKHPNFEFLLGVYYDGVILFWDQLRLAHYYWSQIIEMFVYNEEFNLIIRQLTDHKSSKSILMKFKFTHAKSAKRCYHACVDHHKFFRIGTYLSTGNNDSQNRCRRPQSISPTQTSRALVNASIGSSSINFQAHHLFTNRIRVDDASVQTEGPCEEIHTNWQQVIYSSADGSSLHHNHLCHRHCRLVTASLDNYGASTRSSSAHCSSCIPKPNVIHTTGCGVKCLKVTNNVVNDSDDDDGVDIQTHTELPTFTLTGQHFFRPIASTEHSLEMIHHERHFANMRLSNYTETKLSIHHYPQIDALQLQYPGIRGVDNNPFAMSPQAIQASEPNCIVKTTVKSNDSISSIDSIMPPNFSVPIVPTRSIRFKYDSSMEINKYNTLYQHFTQHSLGSFIPLVVTRTIIPNFLT